MALPMQAVEERTALIEDACMASKAAEKETASQLTKAQAQADALQVTCCC